MTLTWLVGNVLLLKKTKSNIPKEGLMTLNIGMMFKVNLNKSNLKTTSIS